MNQSAIETIERLPVAQRMGIGIFDSGSGGMVTAGFVGRMLEEADLPASTVFFGDTAHLPYGTLDESEVAEFSDRIIQFLAPTCPVIGIACNTASAAWAHHGQVGKDDAAGPRVFSVVQVAAEEAYARANVCEHVEVALGLRAKVVGVLGTQLTARIQSHAEAVVELFRSELSRHAGYQLPLGPYAFATQGAQPTLPRGVIDYARAPHVAVLREDEDAPGGTTRARIMHLPVPAHLPEAVVVVARDAQKLVAAVDVEHVIDESGQLKPEWRHAFGDYLRDDVRLLVRRGATSLILGCTHFEYFARDFANLLPTMAARNAIISPSGALAVRLLDAWQLASRGRVTPINSQRLACFGFSGEPPPQGMFNSLHLSHVKRVSALSQACN